VDDQDDREYSRAPELEDLLSLCKALNAEGVRYVLIGGAPFASKLRITLPDLGFSGLVTATH